MLDCHQAIFVRRFDGEYDVSQAKEMGGNFNMQLLMSTCQVYADGTDMPIVS